MARWNVAAALAGGCCLLPRSMTAGVPPSRDRLRGLLTAGTATDGSCCWLNIHRKYQDIAQAYCAGSAGTTHDLHLAGRTSKYYDIVPMISMGTRTTMGKRALKVGARQCGTATDSGLMSVCAADCVRAG